MTAQSARVSDTRASDRMEWMDELRGVAVLLVMLFHATVPPEHLGAVETGWRPAMDVLLPFRMPLMLVLSGLLLPHSIAKPTRTYFMGKIRRILWPYLVWMIITHVAIRDHWSLFEPQNWLFGRWHMWFLAVLIACYVVGPLTRWLPAWAWVAPLVIGSAFSPTDQTATLLSSAAFFFLGAALAGHLSRVQSMPSAAPIVLLVVAAVYGLAVAGRLINHDASTVHAFVLSVAGIVGMLWLAPRLPRCRWLSWAGRHSLVLYVVNYPVIGMAFLLIGNVSPWILIPTLLVVGYGVPLALTRFSRSILFELPQVRRR